MMRAGLKQINQWGAQDIQAYCAKITYKPIQLLKEKGFWVEDEQYRGHHLFGVRVPRHINLNLVKENMKKNKISVSSFSIN